jgi:CTP synthase (UTP-ammonia lyase)
MVSILPGTRAAKLYGVGESVEPYYCNYGVNPDYGRELEARGLRVSGLGDAGEVRLIEIPDHPFFMATLFLPQARSSATTPHPIFHGFAAAVRDAR